MRQRKLSRNPVRAYQHTDGMRRPRTSALLKGLSLSALVLVVTGLSLYSIRSANAAGTITLVKQVASATQSSYTASNTLTLTVPAGGVAQGDTVIIFAGNNYIAGGSHLRH